MADVYSVSADQLTEFVARQYDDFQFLLESLNKEGKYLNYGYSQARGETYETRQKQLCLAVFDAAEVAPESVIVDVGFGSGEQDFLFARERSFKTLTGYNIAPTQVRYASERARAEGTSDRLIFRHGPAEEMKAVSDASVDRVLAVECAFYFDRPRFYEEAARILRPGGRLVLADIMFNDRLAWVARSTPDLQRVGTREKNRAQWERYFKTDRVQGINRQVIPGAQQTVFTLIRLILRNFHFSQRRAWFTMFKMAVSTQITNLGFLTRLIHYDLIVLVKK